MRGKDNSRTGAEVLVDQLRIHGVQHVFCVPGESYLAALDAFHDTDIAVTVCRQEGGAAMMAEAVGKATGRPGVCFVTRGPGATNASPGIHIARQDSTPMVMFVGQVARNMIEREAFQELDYRAVFGSMCKWATEIEDPARVPEIVSRAFYTAANGRPGPVVVSLPEDMLSERVAVDDAPPFVPVETSPGPAEMAKLAALIGAAKTPMFMIGGSRWSQAACDSLAAFAKKYSLPVCTTFRRLHLFDALHPCYAGDLGIGPNPKLVERIKASDLVVLIGGRLGELPSQSYTLFDIPRPQTTFVHVHPGAEELGRVYSPSLPFTPPRPRSRQPWSISNCRRARTVRPRRRTPTISPGRNRRPSSRAASTSARSWCGCATTFPPTPSSATAPAITRPGFTASSVSAGSPSTSRRPRAPWATECPPRSR